MSDFIKKYEPYNNWLKENIGLDWFDVQEKYKELGNCPGIYPDTAMLLVQMVMKNSINTVVELGSGASTLYFEQTCRKLGKKLISFEEKEEYANLTKNLLKAYNLDITIHDFKNLFDINPQCDVLFVDCCIKSRQEVWKDIGKLNNFNNIEFIVQDDSQNPVYAVPMIEGLSRLGKYNLSFYNPVARADREQLISHRDNEFSTTAWVWSWRPDKTFW